MAITISGSGITSANIADGTIVNADVADLAASKLTGALPAISAASLTNIPAANITGTLPAIDGSALTGIIAGLNLLNTPSADGQLIKSLSDGTFYVEGATPSYVSGGSPQTFTSNGSFTVPSGATLVMIRSAGGGGGWGSGYSTNGGASYSWFGYNGGSGGSINYAWQVSAGDVLSWTLGSGGANASARGSSTPRNGSSGSTTSIQLNGSTIATLGGGGGADGRSSNYNYGSAGSTGTVSTYGNPLTNAYYQSLANSSGSPGGSGANWQVPNSASYGQVSLSCLNN